MFVLKSTLEKQEQKFEAELLYKSELHARIQANTLSKLTELQKKYDELLALEYLDDSDNLSFPKRKFNINKAVELLTFDKDEQGNQLISDKLLATFLFHLVEGLADKKVSHLTTLNQYVLRKLSTIKEKN